MKFSTHAQIVEMESSTSQDAMQVQISTLSCELFSHLRKASDLIRKYVLQAAHSHAQFHKIPQEPCSFALLAALPEMIYLGRSSLFTNRAFHPWLFPIPPFLLFKSLFLTARQLMPLQSPRLRLGDLCASTWYGQKKMRSTCFHCEITMFHGEITISDAKVSILHGKSSMFDGKITIFHFSR